MTVKLQPQPRNGNLTWPLTYNAKSGQRYAAILSKWPDALTYNFYNIRLNGTKDVQNGYESHKYLYTLHRWHPRLYKLWQRICEDRTDCLGYPIPISPTLCVLGDLTNINMEIKRSHMLHTTLSIARKMILMNWKSKRSISVTQFKGRGAGWVAIVPPTLVDHSLHGPFCLSGPGGVVCVGAWGLGGRCGLALLLPPGGGALLVFGIGLAGGGVMSPGFLDLVSVRNVALPFPLSVFTASLA